MLTGEICKHFQIGINSLHKGRDAGLVVLRTHSTAMSIARLRKPRDIAHKTALGTYRAKCAFRFNLKDYPDEFDFSLIENHGWYRPLNRGNNLLGISRDHAVSVRYGFDNDLPADMLAHPANCTLMKHSENASKGKGNLFSYKELLVRINKWNAKYKDPVILHHF